METGEDVRSWITEVAEEAIVWEPADYDAAVAANASLMVDEDEAMVEAIEEYFDAHEALKAGRALDSYAIERQVPGAGGVVRSPSKNASAWAW